MVAELVEVWEKYYTWSPYQYSMNNPISYFDENGEVVDLFIDIAAIAYDLYDIGVTVFKDGEWPSATQAGALAADVGCAVAPFATGGGVAVRAMSHADDAVRVVSHADDAAKAVNKVDDVAVPGKIIANEGGVEIRHYGMKDHGPAHAHVKGGGSETKIGPKGYPLKGKPQLTPKQKKVVNKHKKKIRKEVNKLGKAYKRSNQNNDINNYPGKGLGPL